MAKYDVNMENGYIDVGIHDTMKDLIVDSIGALIFSIVGFFYERQHLFPHIANVFIPTIPTADESGTDIMQHEMASVSGDASSSDASGRAES